MSAVLKSKISEEICRVLPEGTDYVGCHPMAGKETDGFINACVELFWMTGFIIVPPKSAKPESIELLKSVAKYIGATRITQASPEDPRQHPLPTQAILCTFQLRRSALITIKDEQSIHCRRFQRLHTYCTYCTGALDRAVYCKFRIHRSRNRPLYNKP